MSISLSDRLRNFIKSRVTSGEYHNESEYIRDLVRKDREKLSEEQQLLNILRCSSLSGTSEHNIPELMENVKKRLAKDGNL
ncbi:type II toxin-antitoxin system ParD family antitoxin [Kordia sp. SMS9]|uniref:type II toxin-antitoxin system ParD family antitoxin n=1 Tax=Kordia sp. SMS9 TaxID=2282170 RepID=UPI001963C276|nr:type II toxin-antitoxin system ParD family antitoxin [Kordia sp. SMS9]